MTILWLGLALCLIAGFAILGDIRSLPAMAIGKNLSKVSIIIPARNEEYSLPHLLNSLRSQLAQGDELIVVNDQSTDRTAEIARSFGARVIDSTDLPPGWTGKNWACHQGALWSTHDTLLFLDADCFFEEGGYTRLASFAQMQRDRGIEVVSVLPFLRNHHWYENLSLFFNLLMAAGAGRFGWLGEARLFGQCLLLSKSAYRTIGGHEAVKDKVLENVFMAERFADKHLGYRCWSGRGVLSIRMFPQGLSQLQEGWIKAFSRGATATSPSVLVASVLWLSGLATVVVAMILSQAYASWGQLVVLGSLYLLNVLQLAYFARQLGTYRWWSIVAYPVTWTFYQTIFLTSALRKNHQKTWKGRTL